MDREALQSPRATESSSVKPENASQSPWRYPTFADWAQACSSLPTNRQLGGRLPRDTKFPLTATEFNQALEAAFVSYSQGPLAELTRWEGTPIDPTTFFDTTRVYVENNGIPFTPFAQKLQVGPNQKLFVHGDYHGDIHSLLAMLEELNQRKFLEGFTIRDPNTHLLFLGDYTDRGVYGAEVIYTLIRLKLSNPQQVHMARGNHEDLSLTARYGFFTELVGKFGRDYDLRKPLRLYDFLPVVIYLGSENNFIQCNHGGMEPGFNPKALLGSSNDRAFQLIGSLNQKSYANAHPDFIDDLSESSRRQYLSMLRDFRPMSPVQPTTLGFMWNDFSLLREDPSLSFNPGRAWVYGQAATQHILRNGSSDTHRIRAVMRGHQHSSLMDPMMRRLIAGRGVHRHWQEEDNPTLLNAEPGHLATILDHSPKRAIPEGSVFTFNVAPDSSYGIGCQFEFDTYAELDTASNFQDWTLQVHNVQNDKW